MTVAPTRYARVPRPPARLLDPEEVDWLRAIEPLLDSSLVDARGRFIIRNRQGLMPERLRWTPALRHETLPHRRATCRECGERIEAGTVALAGALASWSSPTVWATTPIFLHARSCPTRTTPAPAIVSTEPVASAGSDPEGGDPA